VVGRGGELVVGLRWWLGVVVGLVVGCGGRAGGWVWWLGTRVGGGVGGAVGHAALINMRLDNANLHLL
jgi:hypothetical protein